MKRYASQDAYEQALSHAESKDAPDHMKVPFGSPTANASPSGIATNTAQNDPPALPAEAVPKVHQEEEKFNGDWVLANSILFLQDFGWWTEMSYAVPEGDIGRAFEILKVSVRGHHSPPPITPATTDSPRYVPPHKRLNHRQLLETRP